MKRKRKKGNEEKINRKEGEGEEEEKEKREDEKMNKIPLKSLKIFISYKMSYNCHLSAFVEMLNRRVKFYGELLKAEIPIDQEVFHYLYKITNGCLRYIFGLTSRLMNRLYIGDLTDKVMLDIANNEIRTR